MTAPISSPTEISSPDADEVVATDLPWIVLVWNDPINTMEYVTLVFQRLFGYSKEKATRLMLDVLKKYTKIDPQAFAQMGFMAGKFSTIALLNVKGPVTAKSYNASVRKLKNIKTDMICKPWYVGNALPYHIPNNWDITVDYKGGKVVLKEKCFAIAPVDKEVAQTRVWEKKFKLNTGK